MNDAREEDAFVGDRPREPNASGRGSHFIVTRRSLAGLVLLIMALFLISRALQSWRYSSKDSKDTDTDDSDLDMSELNEGELRGSAIGNTPSAYILNASLSKDDIHAEYLVDTSGSLENLLKWEQECKENFEKYKEDETMMKVVNADCGGGYKRPMVANKKKWKVGLVGDWRPSLLQLSGCIIGAKCPWSPNCEFIRADPEYAQSFDVYLTVSINYPRIRLVKRGPDSISVLYWREALWNDHPSAKFQRSDYDLEMGVHHFAALNNPNFHRPPSFLIKGVYQNSPKKFFAASVISDCATPSLREVYLHELAAILGPDRVHRYGKCGNRDFPAKPIINGMKLLAQYKFYFSFENTIQTGYTSEKLFEIMMLPVVPVYYGDPLAPNITKTPSYIRASDFGSAASLAQYLKYLDAKPEAYAEFHAWRKDVKSFQDDYLSEAKYIPGPAERRAHKLNPIWMSDRRAQCCRLCDGDFLRQKMRERSSGHIVNTTMSRAEIAKFFLRRPARTDSPTVIP